MSRTSPFLHLLMVVLCRCRIIGCGTMLGTSAYLLSMLQRAPKSAVAHRVMLIGMGSAFGALGLWRCFTP